MATMRLEKQGKRLPADADQWRTRQHPDWMPFSTNIKALDEVEASQGNTALVITSEDPEVLQQWH